VLGVAARHGFAGFALDVAFEAPPGVTALFGPSGSGKTSVLSVVAGLLRPASGRVALDGAVLLDTAAGVDVPAERRRCGVVFQEARLLPHLSVASNLRYGARRAPRDAPGEASGPGFEEVVALLGIGPLLDRRPRGLSGGERQRVALGRALLSRPRLLLMDEPLAALDGPRKAEIMPFLERLRDVAALPVLYVTHDLAEVDRLADTLVLMEGGRVVAAGAVTALAARTDLALLSGRRDAGVLLACTVNAHDAQRGLTRLRFPGGALLVPLRAEPVGACLRLRLRARDVAVAIRQPEGVSSHNILPASLAGIVPAGLHEVFATLHVGQTPVLARLTRDAVFTLGLQPGQAVFALVKSTAFDHA
jgi:molybdate transport system ATP-binding protein